MTAAPATKARPGRPSKLTAEVKEVLLDAIRKGLSQDRSARLAGIAERTFYNWKTRAREAEQRASSGARKRKCDAEYLQLLQEIKEAEDERISACLERINAAADRGTWQAAAWILERCHPDEYGRQRHEVTGANGGPVETHGPIRIIQYDRIERTD